MSIYTKKGDQGETSLFGGTRLSKDSLRVAAYGTVDEANAVLGAAYASLTCGEVKEIVRETQRNLFVVGAQLASDEEGAKKLATKIGKGHIQKLEGVIDAYTKEFGGFTGFTIPGETLPSSLLHMARTVVRRSERLAVSLSHQEFVCPLVLKYLNRLSDTLFVLSKVEVRHAFIVKVAERVLALAGASSGGQAATQCLPYESMAAAAIAESERIGVPVCIAIADACGYLHYFKRMDGALLASISISQNKAYTAAVMKSATADLAAPAGSTGPLYGLNTSDNRLVVFAGGIPLVKDGKIVGAVGISGGSIEEDQQIALKAVEAYKKCGDYH